MMNAHDVPTLGDIRAVFAEEIASAGGAVSDTFDDGSRLFLRSVLPGRQEIGPNDSVQSGVALKAAGPDIWVHPYVFRQVCSNGAIRAHAVQTRHVQVSALPEGEAVAGLRAAVRACCAPEAFRDAADEMRSAQDGIDFALSMMPLLSELSAFAGSGAVQEVMARFFGEGDRSRFGLMNAVTSVARDTADPDLRWRLEEFGGGIAVAAPAPMPVLDGPAARELAFA